MASAPTADVERGQPNPSAATLLPTHESTSESFDLTKSDPPTSSSTPAWLQTTRAYIFAQARSPSPYVVYTILFINQIIFSGLHVFSKPALSYFQPFVFASLRILCSLPFIRWLAIQEGGLPHVPASDRRYLVTLGLVGVCLPQGLIFVGKEARIDAEGCDSGCAVRCPSLSRRSGVDFVIEPNVLFQVTSS